MKKAKLLTINLTHRSYNYESVNLELIGGRGFSSEYCAKLADKSAIVIAASRFSQSPHKAAGRYSIGYRAPLYNEFRSSTVRGLFGGAIVSLGLDLISVQGELERYGTVIIKNGEVEFFRGEGENKLDFPFIKIGESGRNFSLIATVCDDGGRQFGRGGLGAVFGTKKLEKLSVMPSDVVIPQSLPMGVDCGDCGKKSFCENIKPQSVADKHFIDSRIFKALSDKLNIKGTVQLESLAVELAKGNKLPADYMVNYEDNIPELKKNRDEMVFADCLGLCVFALSGYRLKPEEKKLVDKVIFLEGEK